MNSQSNQRTNTGISEAQLDLALLARQQQRKHPHAEESNSKHNIRRRDQNTGHLLAHLAHFLAHALFLLVAHLASSPSAAGSAHALAEDALADAVHADHAEEVVGDAKDEEEGEKAEKVVGAFEGAREVAVVVGFVVWDGGGGEGLEGEETAVVLDGFGDEEGDDVVDCCRGAEELNDEGGWAAGTACAVCHEWW